MQLISIAFIVVGLILGYLIAYFQLKSSQALSKEEADALEQEREQALQTVSRLEERNSNLAEQLDSTETELKQAESKANEAEKQLAELNADYRNLKERLDEQKEEMKELQDRFKDEFENLANKILEEKSKKFTEHNREKMDELLKPLSEKMEAFKKKVEETHKEELEARGSLKNELKNLMDLNKQMSEEAKNLTKALKGESKTQGAWGEVILQRILERSGLRKGKEYLMQESITNGDGRRLQPDVVVKLPDEKHLIIDSKVSLTAYERYSSADDEEKQQQALKQHVASLRSHVKGLSSKNYQQLYGGNSPDFVLMFVPIESAFGVALQYDADLYYEAFEKNIVIVSPSTLLATLATIDSVWKQERQNRYAMEIAERGGALYDKFALFVESMQDIGMRMRQTRESYDEAMSRLSTGHGSLTRQVEMLKELGAKASKQLPESMTEKPGILEEKAESFADDVEQE
ncbi:DNA recombination protein RmuC [Aliifodinibius sp. S!AR15-10]|uniref:DNA recombination protein RmuC n=1 Tax=Aliifodinibius sp. S!AR15-10 TaxID=2950437 RepID=UPI0028581DDA|nr:DNA recombination protein RmuC [Aliifodinibius sp. S!AR15-10]MDR8391150.1 DNA recombination protein RmuC [Aliifodinibius sp. S!AR15-10]